MSELGYIRIHNLMVYELNLTIEFLFIRLADRGFLLKKVLPVYKIWELFH